MTGLQARFDRALARLDLPAGTALVAVSGGPDSLALLDLLSTATAARRHSLAVVHVDHGIHPESEAVAARVRETAAGFGLPFFVERLALGSGASETVARRARFRTLRGLVEREGAVGVFLGHHADDQIETMVMRFLRGSGPIGLAGMSARRGPWFRPLLPFSRAELAAHLAGTNMVPWHDPANDDPRHLRSWIRTAVLPLIEGRLPDLRALLAVSQTLYEENRLGWDGVVDLLELDMRAEIGGGSVAAVSLQGYRSPVVRAVLRTLGRRFGLAVGSAEVDRLQVLLAHGHTGQRVDLRGGGVGELAFGRLRLVRPSAHPSFEPVEIEGAAGEVDVGSWRIHWRPEVAPSERLERVAMTTRVTQGTPLLARPWHPGDTIRPIRGRGSRLVVRCMQEAGVPRSRRAGWPVFESGGQAVWVPGVCRGEANVPVPGAPATRIDVSPTSSP